MDDWMQQLMDNDVMHKALGAGELPWVAVGIRLVLALLFGGAVAFIYGMTMRAGRRNSPRPFLATLVLLSVLIALVTLVIGNSLARAFGLVGALSIVRFRTVVQDTRDTAFVIFAVVVGMAAGSGYVEPALIAAPLVFLAAFLFRPQRAHRDVRESNLTIRLDAATPPGAEVLAVLDRHLTTYRITAVETARGGAALDVTYHVHQRGAGNALNLVVELTRLPGVLGAEVRES
ncbi:MAG: DUF4956 domain-containing protein [Gemmataceae bacterium]